MANMMTGTRGDSAGLTAAGAAAIMAWLWFPYRALIIAGVIITIAGLAGLISSARHGRAWHEQDVLIRKLWTAAKKVPSGIVLTDPATGELLTVERERGWLTLAVTDPPAPGARALVTRYPLGLWAAPNFPPLYRHLGALDDLPPARWRWRQKSQLLYLNSQSTALEVPAGELTGLRDQLTRAVLPDTTG